MTRLLDQIELDGYAILPQVLDAARVEELRRVMAEAVSRREDETKDYAMRHLLRDVPRIVELAQSPSVLSCIEPVLGAAAFPVRGIYFDKTPGSNWKVPWHQDLAIAVEQRVEAEGFGPWSVRDGVVQVQPPEQILADMLTIRIHLDDCPADNGALRVIPGSHNRGKLSDSAISDLRGAPAVTCEVSCGGALLMRPLLLHASSPASRPVARRVIHIEFARQPLPHGLRWART